MKRLLTASALIAVAVYLIFWAPGPVFMAAALLMSLLCYWEYSGLVAAHFIARPALFGLFAGLLILFRPQDTLIGITLLVVIHFCVSLTSVNLRDILPQVACSLLGAFYTFAPWRFSADLRHISVHLLFFALALNWAGDSAAYYIGRLFGKHSLAPRVSPKKSWEGAIASVAGSILFGLLYLRHFMPRIAWWQVTGMALLGNVAGQFGDLAESAIKRGAGVKDSGTMLPGHGGMLDRVDSSLFGLPVIHFLYQIMRSQ
ncbi:MAG: phosphatidate cytidylyltransferase [Bryobacteraceae bacterium]